MSRSHTFCLSGMSKKGERGILILLFCLQHPDIFVRDTIFTLYFHDSLNPYIFPSVEIKIETTLFYVNVLYISKFECSSPIFGI